MQQKSSFLITKEDSCYIENKNIENFDKNWNFMILVL